MLKNSLLKRIGVGIFVTIILIVFLQKKLFAFEAGWYSQILDISSISEYAKYGTKIMLPYNGAYLPKNIGPYLFEAQKNNVKVWVDLRLEALTLKESDFLAIIREHKHHPALKGWYISDEPELNITTPAKLQRYYQLCKNEDPKHPVAVAHAHKGFKEFVGGYDYLFVDYYPGWTLYDKNEFNWMVRKSYSVWKEGIAFAKENKKAGFVSVCLGFGENQDGTPRNGVRNLSYAEYRFHTFSAIVQGVDGLLFWIDEWASDKVKDLVSIMISQINSISDAMEKGTTNDPTIKTSHPMKIIYRYGSSETSIILLAVNISGHDRSDKGEELKDVNFSFPEGINISHVEVLNEDRKIPVTKGTFSDHFKRFDVHIYKAIPYVNIRGNSVEAPTSLRINTRN